MNPPDPQAPRPPANAHDFAPENAAPPHIIANELVIHGLLAFLQRRDPAARGTRISRVLQTVNAATTPPAAIRFPRAAKWALIAAAVALAATLFILNIPGETSARAEVLRAIDALRAAPDRRYEVRVFARLADESSAQVRAQSPINPQPAGEPNAVIDSRAPGLLLVRHRPPSSTGPVFVGRDAQGEWAIRPDSTIERARPRPYWPPWSVDGDSLFVDTLDRLLDQLPARYSLERKPAAPIPGAPDSSKTYTRITATRLDRAGPMPHAVELWIDPATNLTDRVEFHWDPTAHAPQAPPPDAPRPNGPPPGDRRPPPPDGPRDHPPEPPPGPLDSIIVQRVDAPPFPPDWFTPEAHRPR